MFSHEMLTMLFVLVLVASSVSFSSSFIPNVVLITVDDVGYNDFGFVHDGVARTHTPELDKYAKMSIILRNYYVHPNGHSTRAALMTGQHPAKLGSQFQVDDATSHYGLDLGSTLLSQHLKRVGYKAHAVGQWDLGFYSKKYIPTSRGFDSFYGSYLPYGNYGTYEATDKKGNSGIDLQGNCEKKPTPLFRTEEITKRAEDIIKSHDDSKPLFLYVSFQAAKMSQKDKQTLCNKNNSPIPNDYWRKVGNISDPTRKCYLALLHAIDAGYSRIMKKLKDQLMLENSVVIFTTTSGGSAAAPGFNAASNSPFRGSKYTGWEGGIRGVSFVYVPVYRGNVGYKECLFHVTDWVPTVLALISDLQPNTIVVRSEELYGTSQLDCIKSGRPSTRSSIIHFQYGNSGAILKDNYKLLIDPSGFISGTDEWYNTEASTITCEPDGVECVPKQNACLFDLSRDKCEKNNVAGRYTERMNDLYRELIEFNRTSVNYNIKRDLDPDPDGNPKKHQGCWQPWIDVNSGDKKSHSFLIFTMSIAATWILASPNAFS